MMGLDADRKDRILYLDEARVLATLAVVLLHVSAGYWGSEPVRTNAWQISNFYDGLVRWAVPVFVMISGALLLDPQKENRIRGRIFRVLIPLVFWSMIYAVVDRLHGASWIDTAEHFLLGHYHLWYLYMLIGLYLLLPFLKTVCKRDELVRYFLMLALLFRFLISQIVEVLDLYGIGFGEALQTMLEKMNVQLVMGYSGYLVLGYWLHTKELSRRSRRIIYALGIAGAMVTVFATIWASVKSDVPEQLFFSYFSCNVLAMSVTVFLLFRNGTLQRNALSWTRKLSPYCFGIFLIHPMVMEMITAVFPKISLSIGIPTITLTVFLISLGAVVAIRKLPIIGKLIL